MKILFESPKELLLGREKRSKLLKVDSLAYVLFKQFRVYLEKNGVSCSPDRMDLHAELLSKADKSYDPKTQEKRIAFIESKDYNPYDRANWGFMGKAFCFFLGPLEGHGGTPHVTLAYLSKLTKYDKERCLNALGQVLREY